MFCSSVIDSCAAFSVWSRPESTASAAEAFRHGLLGSATQGWSNRPSWNFIVRMRRTASLIVDVLILPLPTSWMIALCHWSGPVTSMLMSTPALTASATASGRSPAMW